MDPLLLSFCSLLVSGLLVGPEFEHDDDTQDNAFLLASVIFLCELFSGALCEFPDFETLILTSRAPLGIHAKKARIS